MSDNRKLVNRFNCGLGKADHWHPEGGCYLCEAREEIDRLKGVLVEIRDEKNWIGSGWDMNPDNECPISYGQWVATEAIKGKPKCERCVDTGIDQRIRHDAPGRGDVCDCQKPKEG